jgi:hypothetical protein
MGATAITFLRDRFIVLRILIAYGAIRSMARHPKGSGEIAWQETLTPLPQFTTGNSLLKPLDARFYKTYRL